MFGSLSWSPWNAVLPVHWLLRTTSDVHVRRAPFAPPPRPVEIEPAEQDLRGHGPRSVAREEVRRAAVEQAPPAGSSRRTSVASRQPHSSNCRSAVKRFCVPGVGGSGGISGSPSSSRVRYALTWVRLSLWEPSAELDGDLAALDGAPPECQFVRSVSSISSRQPVPSPVATAPLWREAQLVGEAEVDRPRLAGPERRPEAQVPVARAPERRTRTCRGANDAMLSRLLASTGCVPSRPVAGFVSAIGETLAS